jgi:hypothetical protein
MQSSAAQQAASQQVAQEQKALQTQVASENISLADLAPYNIVGTGAIDQLANLYGIAYNASGSGTTTTGANGLINPGNINATKSSPGGQNVMNAALANFTNTPDYQFAFQQGMQALDRSAAASGTLQSGGQTKAALQYGQGLASQQYGNYFNRLLSLSQIGQSAAAGSATNALNAGNSQANTLGAIGQSQAAGTVGSANAWANSLSGISSSLTTPLLLNSLSGGNGMSAYSNSLNNSLGAYTSGTSANWAQPYEGS